MAIQVQGTTVIDDSRNIVGAKGLAGPLGFNGLAKSAVVILSDNALQIGTPTNNVYYCKMTADSMLSLNAAATVEVPNSSYTIEQVLICIDYMSGILTLYPTISGDLPVFLPYKRYFLTLTRLSIPAQANNSTWFLTVSNPYSVSL